MSPRGDSLWSPPVQDNVVARVLLEHVGGALSQNDPRRTVNYLDLSKLGEEGETPASDEIWLSVAGGAEDDKFLTSDSETYSVATDKLSTAATLAGHVLEGQEGRSAFFCSHNYWPSALGPSAEQLRNLLGRDMPGTYP